MTDVRFRSLLLWREKISAISCERTIKIFRRLKIFMLSINWSYIFIKLSNFSFLRIKFISFLTSVVNKVWSSQSSKILFHIFTLNNKTTWHVEANNFLHKMSLQNIYSKHIAHTQAIKTSLPTNLNYPIIRQNSLSLSSFSRNFCKFFTSLSAF